MPNTGLKRRSESNWKRLENEINLVLNYPLYVLISVEAYQCRPLTTLPTRIHSYKVYCTLNQGFPPSHLLFRIHCYLDHV
jgi:hypothetical protein